MNKIILTTICFLMLFRAFGQDSAQKSIPFVYLNTDSMGNVVYEDFGVNKNTKATMYSNAQQWITEHFGDYKAVVQFEDKEMGRIIIKGILIKLDSYRSIHFTSIIDCRDGKYRIVFKDLYYISYFSGNEFTIHMETYNDEMKDTEKKISSGGKISNDEKKLVASRALDNAEINETAQNLLTSFKASMNNPDTF